MSNHLFPLKVGTRDGRTQYYAFTSSLFPPLSFAGTQDKASLSPGYLGLMHRAVSMEFEDVLFPKLLRKSLCVSCFSRQTCIIRVEQG